jgi:hypothetical protein
VSGSLELVTIYSELHAATLFPGAGEWRLRSLDELESVQVPIGASNTCHVSRILDLPDGTFVAVLQLPRGWRFLRLRVGDLGPLTKGEALLPEGRRSTVQRAADVPVLEGSLTAILRRSLDTGGGTDLPVSGETLQDLVSGR